MHGSHIDFILIGNIIVPEILLGLEYPTPRIAIAKRRKHDLVLRALSLITPGRFTLIVATSRAEHGLGLDGFGVNPTHEPACSVSSFQNPTQWVCNGFGFTVSWGVGFLSPPFDTSLVAAVVQEGGFSYCSGSSGVLHEGAELKEMRRCGGRLLQSREDDLVRKC
ncbi:hypothetical protein LXL04_011871 [Taraxacum kok-saghyz]